MRHIVYSLSAFALVAATGASTPVTVTSQSPATTTAPNARANANANANANAKKSSGNLNGAAITDWNSIWSGGWSGTLSNYLSPNVHLLAPLSVYAPASLKNWHMATPAHTYGPYWGKGTLQYPSLQVQSWFSQGQRFSWGFLPLRATPGFSFTSDMRTCVLKQIENDVHTSNTAINSGWLNPVEGSSTTQLATDVNYGKGKTGLDWISFIIPFGAPNNPVSQQGFVIPFLGILRSPQFFSDVENNCHIPASNFTMLNNAVQWNGNAWTAPATA